MYNVAELLTGPEVLRKIGTRYYSSHLKNWVNLNHQNSCTNEKDC